MHGKLYAPDEVEIVRAERKFSGDGRAARIWGMKNARGAYPNDHSKMMIVVGRESIKKAAHVSSARPSSTPDHFEALTVLPALIKNAILVESHPDEHDDKDVEQVHRFLVPLRVGNRHYRAKLTVKQYRSSVRPGYYTHELSEIKLPASKPLTHAESGSTSKGTAGTLSIGELLTGAKRQDGEPFLKAIRYVVRLGRSV